MLEYKVVIASDAKKLEKEVGAAISDGWQLGPLAVTPTPDGLSPYIFFQSLTREMKDKVLLG